MPKAGGLVVTSARRRQRCTTLLVALSLALLLPATQSGAAEKLTLGAGSKGGVYYILGMKMREYLAPQGIDIEVLLTEGSLENLDLLADENADFGLTQQDTTGDFLEHRDTAPIYVVDRVFFECLHILVRSTLYLRDPAEIRGMRIWPGSPRSGTRQTAMRFLDSIGVTTSQVTLVDDARTAQLPQLFRDRALDIAMVVTVPGASSLQGGFESSAYVLSPLTPATIRLLTGEAVQRRFNRQFFLGAIPRNTYSGQRDAVPTVLVPVLLMARNSVDPAIAGKVADAARLAWASMKDDFPAVENLAEAPSLIESGLPLVPGYSTNLTENGYTRFGPLAIVVVMCSVLAGVAIRNRRSVFKLASRHQVATGVLLTLSLALIATTGTFVFERRVNEHFSTLPESVWSTTLYLLSGLEDRVPYTAEGRAFSVLAMVVGPVGIAALTGFVASSFILPLLRNPMPKNLSGHYVILNWNERTLEIIRQLNDPVITERDGNVPVVIVSDDAKLDKKTFEDRTGKSMLFEDVFFCPGDPTEEWALRNSNAVDAKTVVILADESSGHDADAKTIRSVFTLRRLAEQGGYADLHVVVELLDVANMLILEEMADRFPGTLETIGGSHMRTLVLAQSALNPGLLKVYKDLLAVSDSSNEFYVQKIPDSAAGLTFSEYGALVVSQHPEHPIIPIGVQRDEGKRSEINCNPRVTDEAYQLRKGDGIVVIAYAPPKPSDLPSAAS